MTIEEVIEECVADTSINGKYCRLYRALINEVEYSVSDKKMNSMLDTLNYVGINTHGMSKAEILFEYSQLP